MLLSNTSNHFRYKNSRCPIFQYLLLQSYFMFCSSSCNSVYKTFIKIFQFNIIPYCLHCSFRSSSFVIVSDIYSTLWFPILSWISTYYPCLMITFLMLYRNLSKQVVLESIEFLIKSFFQPVFAGAASTDSCDPKRKKKFCVSLGFRENVFQNGKF